MFCRTEMRRFREVVKDTFRLSREKAEKKLINATVAQLGETVRRCRWQMKAQR